MKTRFGHPLLSVCAMAVGGVLAVALPAGAAVSVQSQSTPAQRVELGKTATLQANGAAVFTALNVICRPGGTASLTVIVTQNAGGKISSGSAYRDIEDCTGKPQNLQVAVTPSEVPYIRGVAFGQASLRACNSSSYQCATVRDEHEIWIA
jgi:hypothetical protein